MIPLSRFMHRFRKISVMIVLSPAFLLSGISSAALAADAVIAVAANFSGPMQDLVTRFEKTSGHHITSVSGSSGRFLTQIRNGAPFDAFLSADTTRPDTLIAEQHAVRDSAFIYATGRLVLWSTDPKRPASPDMLRSDPTQAIAICLPEAAPYGTAAVETMQALGLYSDLKTRLVKGADVSQAFMLVNSHNAGSGFVALSQLHNRTDGTRWIVPQSLYTPLRQKAALLTHGEQNSVARDFLKFLKTPEARAIITSYGYTAGDGIP